MRVAIVNDLALATEGLRRIVAASGRHTVAWTAADGQEAVDSCRHDPPDLILMDMIMPVMDGVEATRRIMRQSPCPILVVTADVTSNSSLVFQAMAAGALDAVTTPTLGGNNGDLLEAGRDLLRKMERIERLTATPATPSAKKARRRSPREPAPTEELVVIGASTGGPQALVQILSRLPADFRLPVVVAQHMDEKFLPGLVSWLDEQVKVRVRGLRRGDFPAAGRVLVACTDGHARMTQHGQLLYSAEPREAFYHPSVDVLFQSVAEHWPGSGVGILLTGMGRDGAAGLLALRRRGFYTIAQEEKSCVVFGMPRHAQRLGAANAMLPPPEIGDYLVHRHEQQR